MLYHETAVDILYIYGAFSFVAGNGDPFIWRSSSRERKVRVSAGGGPRRQAKPSQLIPVWVKWALVSGAMERKPDLMHRPALQVY